MARRATSAHRRAEVLADLRRVRRGSRAARARGRGRVHPSVPGALHPPGSGRLAGSPRRARRSSRRAARAARPSMSRGGSLAPGSRAEIEGRESDQTCAGKLHPGATPVAACAAASWSASIEAPNHRGATTAIARPMNAARSPRSPSATNLRTTKRDWGGVSGKGLRSIRARRSGAYEALHERQRPIGGLAPSAVDRERVAATLHLDELGGAPVLFLLLERRVRDRPRGTVWSCSPDTMSRGRALVLGVDRDFRPRIEVRHRCLEKSALPVAGTANSS